MPMNERSIEVIGETPPAAILLTYLDGNYVSTDKVSGLNTEVLLGHHAVGVMWNIEDWEIKD